MLLDLHNNIEVRRAISPTRSTDNTALTGQTIDLANVTQCEFLIATGTIDDANATFAVEVQDSPDDSVWTAVDDAFLLGTEALAAFTFSDDNEWRKIGYIGPQRYVRIVITPSGNSANPNGADISCLALLSGHREKPQSSQG